MARRTRRRTRSFVAYREDGGEVTIDEFRDFNEVSTTDSIDEIPGMKMLMTNDGQHVNRIGKGKYQIVETGQILTSNDRTAV